MLQQLSHTSQLRLPMTINATTNNSNNSSNNNNNNNNTNNNSNNNNNDNQRHYNKQRPYLITAAPAVATARADTTTAT